MHKVLVVSHRFPPHGGGGVQRTTYFVRHLSEYGWIPHVLTGPLGRRKLVDEGLLAMIPDRVRVTRTGQWDPRTVFRVADRLRVGSALRALTPSFPHMEAGWIRQATSVGARLLEEDSFDLIYSSSYPISSHVVARRLKRRAGLPWVADYRDEWSLRPVLRWPSPVHRRLARRIDNSLIREADGIVTTSPAHTASLSSAFGNGVDDPRFVTITNGYDEGDFEGPVGGLSDPTLADRFVVTHVGSVFRWRGADAILKAVEELTARGTTPRLTMQFIGRTSDLGFGHLAAAGYLRSSGYVTHPEAVASMRRSDVLLLINTERANIPGKTWEYLAAGRPILAAVKEGPTAALIREYGAGTVVDPQDSAAIGRVLRDLYDQWEAGNLPESRSPEGLVQHERRALTGRLAGVFDRVADAPVAESAT